MLGDDPHKNETTLSLREQAETVLRLASPEERLKLLLDAPKPMALVRTLPDADFHLTVREIGPQDALPLLALASSPQIAHLLDLEGWRGDRIDPTRFGAWVALLAESGEATLRRFARSADDETLILLFHGWLHVRPLEIDHEEPTRGHGVTEAGDERGFVAPDGSHLFAPEHTEHAPAGRRLAEILFLDDQARYLGIVRSALFELPSEVEEEALRWRNSRLEEHGYPPFEEALSVYAAPVARTTAEAASGEREAAAPRAALRSLRRDNAVVAAIDLLTPGERERVLEGLTNVAHRVLVADGADPGSLDAQRAVLLRAGAYVGIGLERRGAREPAPAAAVLRTTSPIELFREGYAEAASLAARARALVAALGSDALLDAPLLARVRALCAPRPQFVAEGDEPARDFRTVAEIEETKVTLELCETLVQALLARRGTDARRLAAEERRPFEDLPRFSTLLLTALAWHAVRGAVRVDRLPQDAVADFLRIVASRRTADPEAPSRSMDRLVGVLAAESSLSRRAAAALRAFGTTALDRLAADCANLDPGLPVTPRVVGSLRLA
ncbi:MAG TPA: DUF6178 family protein [Candidatus Polarisedimenticolaceae bacterium]|nr:DUF6178 family protein [Candidatus Polarisedimenticolaceae bacterium]